MKTQVGFEQFAAISIFVSAVLFLIYQLLTYYSTYLTEIKRMFLLSEAYQVSELLVNDVGSPANWYEGEIKRIGLINETLNKTNVLSLLKVNSAITICNSDYQKFKKMLDLKNEINLFVYLEGNLMANCSRGADTGIKFSRIVSFDNGSYGELVVWLY